MSLLSLFNEVADDATPIAPVLTPLVTTFADEESNGYLRNRLEQFNWAEI
jgi:hypothetical protein